MQYTLISFQSYLTTQPDLIFKLAELLKGLTFPIIATDTGEVSNHSYNNRIVRLPNGNTIALCYFDYNRLS